MVSTSLSPGLIPPPPPFDPVSLITGAGGFWRADNGVTQSGGNVTAWADQSSFANNLSAGASDPTFSSTGFNSSFPGVTMTDTTTNSATVTLPFNSSTGTIFELFQSTTLFGSRLSALIATVASGGTGHDFDNTLSFDSEYDGASIFHLLNNNVSFGTQVAAGSTIYLLGYVWDGINMTQWVNGSAGSGGAFSSTIGGNVSNPSFFIGANPITGAHAALGANVAFCGLTQKAMNSTDWTNLKKWSNSNWGTSF